MRCEIGRGVTRIFNETLYTRTGKLNEKGGEKVSVRATTYFESQIDL